ncbi:hypothetical protein [Chondromyces crocatus]|uniref:Uncharacterized protein n=1 Tax=Chondromyces crocatus TaxID=52 RepID=A0A0K1EG36_CHOCO|nr:hypothetical protein [Chondromyces crocatus]AKT39809.1 uncharacterized protein CMC5_039600 [Chondromyces crocatus]
MRNVLALAGSVSALVAIIVSCGGGDELPPPRGGAGASGATGGTTTTTTTSAEGPGNICECAAAYGGSRATCADCVNAATAPGAACKAVSDACSGAACTDISLCLSACGRDVTCQRDCLFPAVEGPEHALYREVIACACDDCGSRCRHSEPLECPAWGSGGGGGSGGSGAGGEGGSAGAGAAGSGGNGGA